LVGDKFFRTALGDALRPIADLKTPFPQIDADILIEGSVTNPDTRARASNVTLIASDENGNRIGDLRRREMHRRMIAEGKTPPVFILADIKQKDDEIYLNQP